MQHDPAGSSKLWLPSAIEGHEEPKRKFKIGTHQKHQARGMSVVALTLAICSGQSKEGVAATWPAWL